MLIQLRAGQEPYACTHLKSCSEPVCKGEGLCPFSLVKMLNAISVMRDVNLTLSVNSPSQISEVSPICSKIPSSVKGFFFFLTTLLLKDVSSLSKSH